MDTRTANSERSTSMASRVSSTMPTVWRSRSTGSATVTSNWPSRVRRISGGISWLSSLLVSRSSWRTSGCQSGPGAFGASATVVARLCGTRASTPS